LAAKRRREMKIFIIFRPIASLKKTKRSTQASMNQIERNHITLFRKKSCPTCEQTRRKGEEQDEKKNLKNKMKI
jgi:hypothetical protein